MSRIQRFCLLLVLVFFALLVLPKDTLAQCRSALNSDDRYCYYTFQANGNQNFQNIPCLQSPQLQNGAFTIQCANNFSFNAILGDGFDETTTWNYNTAAVTPPSDYQLKTATLTLTLAPVAIPPGGIDTDTIQIDNLRQINSNRIQNLVADGVFREIPPLDLLSSYTVNEMLNAIQQGTVQFSYQDDSIISSAQFDLVFFRQGSTEVTPPKDNINFVRDLGDDPIRVNP